MNTLATLPGTAGLDDQRSKTKQNLTNALDIVNLQFHYRLALLKTGSLFIYVIRNKKKSNTEGREMNFIGVNAPSR